MGGGLFKKGKINFDCCHLKIKKNTLQYSNEKVDLLYSRMLQKIPTTSKNASNKNCSELNVLQKTHWAHMSIFSRRGLGDSKEWYL